MIDGLTNSTAVPVLERMMQFSGQRHRLIANNIANLSTPGFRPRDVSVEKFQEQLAQAVDNRRLPTPNGDSKFVLASSAEVEFGEDYLMLHPKPVGENILFHDGNDRNVERVMQDLVENFMAFRASAQLLKSRFSSLQTAIRERL